MEADTRDRVAGDLGDRAVRAKRLHQQEAEAGGLVKPCGELVDAHPAVAVDQHTVAGQALDLEVVTAGADRDDAGDVAARRLAVDREPLPAAEEILELAGVRQVPRDAGTGPLREEGVDLRHRHAARPRDVIARELVQVQDLRVVVDEDLDQDGGPAVADERPPVACREAREPVQVVDAELRQREAAGSEPGREPAGDERGERHLGAS